VEYIIFFREDYNQLLTCLKSKKFRDTYIPKLLQIYEYSKQEVKKIQDNVGQDLLWTENIKSEGNFCSYIFFSSSSRFRSFLELVSKPILEDWLPSPSLLLNFMCLL